MAIARPSSSGVGSLLRGALLVAGAGLFANVLNLGVSVLIAHLLRPVPYGTYSQMVGLFFVVALPGSALSVAVVRRAASYLVRDDEELMQRWQRRLNERILRLAVAFSAVALIASVALAHWLGHRSWLAVWINTLAAITWAVLNVDRALLQVRQRYVALASNFVIEGVARTVFMVLGSPFGVTGIVSGLLIAILLARFHARWLVGVSRTKFTGPALEHTGITTDLLVALVTLALLATLQFIDVFLVGRYEPHRAGSYSAISQVAKTLVYGAIILGSFLLPETAIATKRGREAFRQLGIAGGLLAIPATLLLLIAEVGAHPILRLVFGARYAHDANSLGPLVWAMIFLGASTLLATYLLASGERWPTLFLAVVTVAGTLYVSGARGLPATTVHRDVVVQAVCCLGLTLLTIRQSTRGESTSV